MKTKQKLAGSKNRFIFFMLLPALILPLIFTYYPMIKGSLMAFQSYNLMNVTNIKWIGLGNFQKLFANTPGNIFYTILKNTAIWVIVSLFFQFTIGFALALLLRKKFRGSSVYQGLIFFPWAVSGFLIGIMWRWMFNGTSGVINDILLRIGIIHSPIAWLASKDTALLSVIIANIWYGIPFFTIMITAALRGVPQELYEAAEVDGANAVGKFFNITIPSIKSVILLTILMRVIWIFNFPDLIYSMTQGGPGGSSHIITSFMMQKVQSLDYGLASALGLLVILFLTVFTIIYFSVTKFGKLED
ncbi:MAG TPA: sugar ABC transporter permease [Flexilinea sp.]|jgi:multiple sugar transport system permease protein|nr:sugar ABC transporter permease [Flexilinea sp.]OQA28167.1 MAG: Lactose transport system permease protein LacF [Chloroflexi bacterium ADurb.Bin344]HOU20412.1 sugar ABC transporter permease [Flexilinea sp.]HPG19925.1 sugar ABC transporter permease [Flexilinea sp.]HPL57809.1 sugar ABC transporter permease [Flexilinea sp.]